MSNRMCLALCRECVHNSNNGKGTPDSSVPLSGDKDVGFFQTPKSHVDWLNYLPILPQQTFKG